MTLWDLCNPSGTGFTSDSTILAYLDLKTFIILIDSFLTISNIMQLSEPKAKIPHNLVNSDIEIGSYSGDKVE